MNNAKAWHMFDEEEIPNKKEDMPKARLLDDLSVEEMRDYIAWLEEEIGRVKAEISKRGEVASAAEALFS